MLAINSKEEHKIINKKRLAMNSTIKLLALFAISILVCTAFTPANSNFTE